MNDQELVFFIADFMGFDRDFRRSADFPESLRPVIYVDAECCMIPDYVWILGRRRAAELLESLQTVQRFGRAEVGEVSNEICYDEKTKTW